MNIASLVTETYADQSVHALAAAPLSALRGVSEADARALQSALGVNTIRQLAELGPVRCATAIATLADLEDSPKPGSTLERQIDAAVKMSFPASDPVSIASPDSKAADRAAAQQSDPGEAGADDQATELAKGEDRN